MNKILFFVQFLLFPELLSCRNKILFQYLKWTNVPCEQIANAEVEKLQEENEGNVFEVSWRSDVIIENLNTHIPCIPCRKKTIKTCNMQLNENRSYLRHNMLIHMLILRRKLKHFYKKRKQLIGASQPYKTLNANQTLLRVSSDKTPHNLISIQGLMVMPNPFFRCDFQHAFTIGINQAKWVHVGHRSVTMNEFQCLRVIRSTKDGSLSDRHASCSLLIFTLFFSSPASSGSYHVMNMQKMELRRMTTCLLRLLWVRIITNWKSFCQTKQQK